jgi:FtsH-binding integral membrane protein
MTNSDYPALYQAADAASVKSQNVYLRCVKWYAALAILGGGLGSYGIESRAMAAAAAIVFSIGLFLSVLMAARKYENMWYRARAVAESIKTSSWRFMMGANPFDYRMTLDDATLKFMGLLQNILREHKDFGAEFGGAIVENTQLSGRMLQVRSSSLIDRKHIYEEERIIEQRGWYAGKSKYNNDQGQLWFWLLVALQGSAIFFTVLRIVEPSWKFLPTEVFVVAATSALGWIQVKRFRELAAAYAVAAHEIGLAQAELAAVATEDQWSQFVADTENAFSREHTHWIARKR